MGGAEALLSVGVKESILESRRSIYMVSDEEIAIC